MKKSDIKIFMLGILAIALILIAFTAVTAVSINKSSNGNIIAYADEYDGTSTAAATTITTAMPTNPNTSTAIGIYNGIIQYSSQYSRGTVVVTILECSSNASGELEIPETINGMTVADIRSSAFSKCESLDSITLPETIKEIGYTDLFNSNLKKLVIKNPECEIYSHWDTIPESTVIYGYADSTAQQYAQSFGRQFVTLDGQPSKTTPPAAATTITTERPIFPDTSTSIGIYNGIIQYSGQYDSSTETVAATILECSSNASGELEIPETINGMTVADIKSSAFSKCANLDSITLPETIKKIRYTDLFNSNLKKLVIKNPECEIYSHWDTIPESTVIYGYADSTAQQYAQFFGRQFVIFDGQSSAVTPTEPTTTAPERKFGDINGDGLVDANDASVILAYYAYVSTGGTADLEEYLGL